MFYVGKYKVRFRYEKEFDLSHNTIVDVVRCYIIDVTQKKVFLDRNQTLCFNDVIGFGSSAKNPKDKKSNRKIGREYAFLRAVSYLPQELHEKFLSGYRKMANDNIVTEFVVPINETALPNGTVIDETGKINHI